MIICFCFNNVGAIGLGATLNSLVKKCSAPARLHIYFLCAAVHKNIKDSTTALLKELDFQGKYYFIDFDPYNTFHKYKSLQNDWTPYGRLLIADFIKNEKVIYLDTDLIIETDVLKIFDIDLKNFTVAAIPGAILKYSLENRFFIETIKMDPGLMGFNSGVLLIDTGKWTDQNIKGKLLAIANQYPDKLLAADQTLLNILFADNFFQLSSKYNVPWYANNTPEINDGNIFHFVGSPKPWDFLGKYFHTGYAKWKQYEPSGWSELLSTYHKKDYFKRAWSIRRSYIKLLLKNK